MKYNAICFSDGHSDRKYFSDRSSSRKTRCLYYSSEISKFWLEPASPIEEFQCNVNYIPKLLTARTNRDLF